MRTFSMLFATMLLASSALAGPRVIASVVPVQGIVAAVMEGAGTPELLLSGQMSEHRAAYTPAQIEALGKADLVFIVGHGLEAKLAQLSGSETVNGKSFIELSEAPGVRHLSVREGGAWEAHHHEDEEEGQEHDHAEGVLAFDPHVWLDPENAKAMANTAAAELAKADPANAATYEANAKAFSSSLDTLSTRIAVELAPVKDVPFIVFHDAYQYFESRFGLNAAGSISDVSATAPSAERLREVRDKLNQAGAKCVFREPQYDSRTVDVVIEGTKAKAGVLDPLGAALEPGPGAYPKLLDNLAAALAGCLSG